MAKEPERTGQTGQITEKRTELRQNSRDSAYVYQKNVLQFLRKTQHFMLYTWGYVMLLYVCEKEESLVIKKTKIKFADGTEKTQIRVIKSIRCGEQKKPKQITVKSFGYKEENGKASLELNEDNDYLRNDWLALQKSFGVDLDFVLTERNIFDKRLNGIKLRSMKNGK